MTDRLATPMILCLCLEGCATGPMMGTGGSVAAPTSTDTASRTAIYALPKALVPVTVTYPPCTQFPCPQPALTIGDNVYIPDANHIYSIDTDFSTVSHDTVNVELTPNGLLSKISTTADDATGLLITETAKLVANIVQAAASFSSVAAAPPPPSIAPPAVNYPALQVMDTLDVLDEASLGRFNARLAQLAWRSDADLAKAHIAAVKLLPRPATAIYTANGETRCTAGVCFRPLLPYTLGISWVSSDGSATVDIQHATVLLPNEAPILSINLNRTPYVKRVTALEFQNGMLSKSNIDKPSEALAALSAPVDALATIIAIPSQLFTIRTQQITNSGTIYDDRLKQLNSEAAYLKAVNALKNPAPTAPQ